MLKKLAAAAVALVPVAAFAALPTEVDTAFTTAATDAALVWGAMVTIALVGLSFKLGIIGVRKAPGMVR